MIPLIAIVDDDEAIRDAVRLVLEENGWHARTYASGEIFLAEVETYEPDCVVLDSYLPGMSGTDVLQVLAERYPMVPVVGLTAQPLGSVTKEIIDSGACSMLTKPVAADDLLDVLRAALECEIA